MPPLERRKAPDIGRWTAIAVGVFTIIGVIVEAGISYGQHMRADTEQDTRLVVLEQRVRDLERAERWLHGDQGLLPNAPKGDK